MDEFLPAHIQGRRFEVLKDPAKTIDQKGLDIGGYIRISTKKDSQKTSIENQKKFLQQWADLEGYNLVRFYIDVKTGKFMYQRSEVNEMMDDVKNAKIRGIVSKEISRTSRDISDILELKRKIVIGGGFFRTIKENYDSRTDDDEFFLILHGALAQKEQKTTANRVKITQMIKAKEGKTNVAHPAYGYMLSEDKQHLVKNPTTAPTHRFIVEKYLGGWGHLKIAKYLNNNKIPSKRGGRWCSNSVRVVLNNPVYLGITIYNTTTLIRGLDGKQKRVLRPQEDWVIRHNTHEPLISEEEFKAIQGISQKRRENDCKEWSCERKYIGSTLLRCSVCGGKIYGTRFMSEKKGAGYHYRNGYYYRYICRGLNGKCTPKMKYWKMEIVDRNIRELFRILFGDKERLLNIIQKEPGIISNDAPNLIKERDEVHNKLKRIEQAIKKQQIAFENEVINLGEYKNRMEELRKEKNAELTKLSKLDYKLSRHDSTMDRLMSVFNRVADKIDRFHELPKEEVVEYLDTVFERIYLGEDGSIVDVQFRS
jgi:DNA invertase Pin-like site-specific DNA recombinase